MSSSKLMCILLTQLSWRPIFDFFAFFGGSLWPTLLAEDMYSISVAPWAVRHSQLLILVSLGFRILVIFQCAFALCWLNLHQELPGIYLFLTFLFALVCCIFFAGFIEDTLLFFIIDWLRSLGHILNVFCVAVLLCAMAKQDKSWGELSRHITISTRQR